VSSFFAAAQEAAAARAQRAASNSRPNQKHKPFGVSNEQAQLPIPFATGRITVDADN
jgi:hypothetical protein